MTASIRIGEEQRKGTVICLNLSNTAVSRQKKLNESRNIMVLHDVKASNQAANIYADNTIFGLSFSNGNALFSPITGAAAPSLLLNSNLYYGNNNDELIAADSMSSAIKTSIYTIPKLDSFYRCYYHL